MDKSYYERIIKEWPAPLALQFLVKKCLAYEGQIESHLKREYRLREILRKIKEEKK